MSVMELKRDLKVRLVLKGLINQGKNDNIILVSWLDSGLNYGSSKVITLRKSYILFI